MRRSKLAYKISARLKRFFKTQYIPLKEAEAILDLIEKNGIRPSYDPEKK